jgi:hypothetical protein
LLEWAFGAHLEDIRAKAGSSLLKYQGAFGRNADLAESAS